MPDDDDRARLASTDPDVISKTLVDLALGDDDGEWVEAECLRLADHPDAAVRGTAGLCLGHLARRFHRVRPESWAVARRLCADPAVDNRPCDALDDMRQFAGPDPHE